MAQRDVAPNPQISQGLHTTPNAVVVTAKNPGLREINRRHQEKNRFDEMTKRIEDLEHNIHVLSTEPRVSYNGMNSLWDELNDLKINTNFATQSILIGAIANPIPTTVPPVPPQIETTGLITTFIDLDDTPNKYVGEGYSIPVVNAAENALFFTKALVGAYDITGQLRVDNIKIDGNQISNTSTPDNIRMRVGTGANFDFIDDGLAGSSLLELNNIDTLAEMRASYMTSAGFVKNDADGVFTGGNTIDVSDIPSGVDHGGLSGLTDDDHSQYLLLAGRGGQSITDAITITGSLAVDNLSMNANALTSTSGAIEINASSNFIGYGSASGANFAHEFSGSLYCNTSIEVDNLKLDGNTLSTTSGDLTVTAAGGDILTSNKITCSSASGIELSAAAGGMLTMNANGTTEYVIDATTGNLNIGISSGADRYVNLENTNGSFSLGLLVEGKVGIGTTDVPHGSVGMGVLAIEGANASTAGPHIQFTTPNDDYPLLQIMPYFHDDVAFNMDAYWDGSNWRSSDAGSNFQTQKLNDLWEVNYNSGTAAGSTFTWTDGVKLNTSGQFSVRDGSVSAPGLAFSADLNCGLYRSSTDTVGLVAGGLDRIVTNSAIIKVYDLFEVEATQPSELVTLDQNSTNSGASFIDFQGQASTGNVLVTSMNGAGTVVGPQGQSTTEDYWSFYRMVRCEVNGTQAFVPTFLYNTGGK